MPSSRYLSFLLAFVRSHGCTVRFTRDGAIYAAAPATIHGCECSDLSPALSTLTQARDWLGY